ncbi:transposase [Crossiella sp. CA198]|uniref:transposase n=1 Tax=Crossiella sp. CA198 TaxID=3455607 RepID=UPI003F8D7E4B
MSRSPRPQKHDYGNRRGVLAGEHHDFHCEVFTKACSNFGAHLNERNGEDDHVYLLVEYRPWVAVSGQVRREPAPPGMTARYTDRTSKDRQSPPCWIGLAPIDFRSASSRTLRAGP